MSDVAKKKQPDFNSLDFSNLGTPGSEITKPEITTVEEKPTGPQEGTWILGKSLDTVTVTEFKQWLKGFFDESEVEKFTESDLSTTKQKEKLIYRLQTLNKALGFPRTSKVEKKYDKKYEIN